MSDHCAIEQRLRQSAGDGLERFQAKWKSARVKKTRQIKNLEPRFIQSKRKRL
jgi:hypothetical protein